MFGSEIQPTLMYIEHKKFTKPYITRWRRWLRYCAKSRKVAGSIPDGVIGIFH
jgi:hypothetical protein